MPPKSKGAKKDKKSTKTKKPTVIDGVSTDEMSKEQLEEHILRLREELDREREERNYFQLERDKIHTFWEITKRHLDETKAELRIRDRETEEAEQRHQVEIKVYKQKVKHLLYEHQNNISELKVDGVVSAKLMQRDHVIAENELYKGMRALNVDFKELELASENDIKCLKLKHSEEITKTRKDFQEKVREIEVKYNKKMNLLQDELDHRRKTEISEIEERKNSHINTLMKNHDKAFSDIKNYYNDITLNNLNLIESLKNQIDTLKKKEERLEKNMAEVMNQNKNLTEPLDRAKEEVKELQKQLLNYEKDKASLASARARLKVEEKETKGLKWEHEVLEQRFSKVQMERDELYKKFTQAIQVVQQKSGFKNVLLEKKLSALTDTLEKKEAQLSEVLSATNMDPSALGLVTQKLEEVLDSKNVTIKDLQYEVARVCKAHNDLLQTFEAKLKTFGIPVEGLVFTPLESGVVGQPLGHRPACLFSVPKLK